MAKSTELMDTSPTLKGLVEKYLLKLILGPGDENNEERLEQLRNGDLDELLVFTKVPHLTGQEEIIQLKVKDIRKNLNELYADLVFKFVDIEELVKKQIEEKGIVVIDEIDKLVRQ